MDIENKIIERIENLDAIVDKFQDLAGSTRNDKKQEEHICNVEDIRQFVSDVRESGRLLRVGIIGRVKAGKSSLLNALLFDGQEVLPKAATPMTASLTTISYGTKPSARVEFFSVRDVSNLKNEHDQYIAEFERRVEEKIASIKNSVGTASNSRTPVQQPDPEKIRASVRRDLDSNVALSAAHDLYQRIIASGLDLPNRPTEKELHADNIESLGSQLRDYVGADGKYMPLTKCLHVKLPQERLEGLYIIDTPGINDPIASREQRT